MQLDSQDAEMWTGMLAKMQLKPRRKNQP